MSIKQVRSVSIKFTDGTTREIFAEVDLEGYDVESFYKEESVGPLTDHTVYFVNAKHRDTPKLGFD